MIAALLALAAASAPLQPIGKWVVSYNTDDCTLQRDFGETTARATFGFRPAPSQISGDLVLSLAGKKGYGQSEGKITLEPGSQVFKIDWARGPLAGDRHGYRMRVEQDFWDALPAAESIRFDFGGNESLSASLGPMINPLKAIKACGDVLLRGWGADPDNIVRLEQPRSILNWFTADAYPRSALSAGEGGRVNTLTLFDRAGKPIRCHVVVPSGSVTLDQKTCEIMMQHATVRADPNGPERRFLFVPVRWVLPS